METIACRLGRFAAGPAPAAAPPAVRAAAAAAVRDTWGCVLAGRGSAPDRVVLAQVSSGPDGIAVPGGPAGLSVADAALLGGTRAHAFDFDDVVMGDFQHGSAVIVPAALAAAQDVGASGAALIEAVIAGLECALAIGRAAGHGIYDAGWWPTGVISPIGAAAAVARLLGCDRRQAGHAVALAALQAFGYRQFFGSPAKAYLAGRAAAAGLTAATAARAGLEAPGDVFEGPHGFIDRFSSGGWAEAPFAHLGDPWQLSAGALAVKAWPLCSCALAAVDAVLRLRERMACRSEEVTRIDCRVTPIVADALIYDRPAKPTELLFSLPYALALALRHGTITPAHIAEQTLTDPEIAALAARVSHRVDPALVDVATFREAAEVTLQLQDGREASELVEVALGDPRNPMSATQQARKLQDCAATCLGPEGARRLVAALDNLDGPESLEIPMRLSLPE